MRRLASITPIALAIASSIALSSCSGTAAPSSASESLRRDVSASAVPTPTPTPTPTQIATFATPPPIPDPDNPDPLPESTAPGTRLAMGESMVVRKAVGVRPIEEGWSIVRYTVTSIKVGDQALLQGVRNLGEFEGGTLYFIRGRVEVLALFGWGIDGIVGGTIAGIQSDGSGSSGIFSVGHIDTCTDNFLVIKARVGATQDSCTIAIARPGQTIIGAMYYGDGTVPSGGSSTDPYYLDPIVWLQ